MVSVCISHFFSPMSLPEWLVLGSGFWEKENYCRRAHASKALCLGVLTLQDWVDCIIKVTELKITGLWSLNFCIEDSYSWTDLGDSLWAKNKLSLCPRFWRDVCYCSIILAWPDQSMWYFERILYCFLLCRKLLSPWCTSGSNAIPDKNLGA